MPWPKAPLHAAPRQWCITQFAAQALRCGGPARATTVGCRPGSRARTRLACPDRSPVAAQRRGRIGLTRCQAPHDRRTSPPQGTQGRGSARPRRTTSFAVLPVHRPGHAAGQGGRQHAIIRPWRGLGADPQGALRTAIGQRGGGGRATRQEARAADLQLGRGLVVGVRDGRDPARPGARRGRGAARVDPGRDGDRRAADGRVDLVPPGLPRLPVGRRRLRGRQGEPVTAPWTRRGGCTPDRLRHDRRRLDGLGGRAGLLGGPRPVRHPDRDRDRVDRADHDRQPARPPRGGPAVRKSRPTCSSGLRSS